MKTVLSVALGLVSLNAYSADCVNLAGKWQRSDGEVISIEQTPSDKGPQLSIKYSNGYPASLGKTYTEGENIISDDGDRMLAKGVPVNGERVHSRENFEDVTGYLGNAYATLECDSEAVTVVTRFNMNTSMYNFEYQVANGNENAHDPTLVGYLASDLLKYGRVLYIQTKHTLKLGLNTNGNLEAKIKNRIRLKSAGLPIAGFTKATQCTGECLDKTVTYSRVD